MSSWPDLWDLSPIPSFHINRLLSSSIQNKAFREWSKIHGAFSGDNLSVKTKETIEVLLDVCSVKRVACDFEIKWAFNNNPNIYYCQIYITPLSQSDFLCQLVDLTNDRKENIRLQISMEDGVRRLESNNKELEIVNSELKNFAYVVSHDLAEPLRMISSWSSLLASEYKDSLDSEAQSYIDFIIEGASRLRKQIADILDLSRVGTHKLNFSEIDLNAVLGDVYESIYLLLEETNTEIISCDLPMVRADFTQMARLFQNLIINSVKFRKPNERPSIRISYDETPEQYLFHFEDNGIGFSPVESDRIFQAFQRLNPGHEGSGIGLAICRKVVEQHGGRIWADGQEGLGAKFHFTIRKFS